MDPKKKAKISAIFADTEEENYKVGLANLARKLAAIWAPAEGSMLHSIIAEPTQVDCALSDRLNPTNQTPLKLVGHPFKDVHSTILKLLATASTAAHEKDCKYPPGHGRQCHPFQLGPERHGRRRSLTDHPPENALTTRTDGIGSGGRTTGYRPPNRLNF